MEKCIGCELCAGVCPARCIYVRGADNPPDDPVSPGRALRLRLRDQLPALHPLRPVRRGLPDRGDHRDRSCSSSPSPTASDAIYTKAELLVDDDGKPQQLPWEDWREGDDQHTSAWMRATAPSRRRRLRGQRRLVGRARLRRARARARPGRRRRRAGRRRDVDDRRRTTTATTAHGRPLMDDSLVFVVAAAIVLGGALGVVLAAQPGARRAQPGGDAVRRRRAVRRPGRPLPRRRAGDRLRRRHRRAVPVRDHAARRRPGRGPRDEPLDGPAPARRRRRRRRARPGRRGRCSSPAARRVTGPAVGRAARCSTGEPDINVSSARSLFTDYVFAFEVTSRAARHRRRRRRGAGPPAATARRRPRTASRATRRR